METMMPIASTSISMYLNPYSSSSLPTISRVTVPTFCFSSHLAAFNRVWWPRNLRKTTALVWSGKKSPPPLKTAIRCGGSNKVREINESEFYDVVLKSERPVLVEFVATWCGPCRLIAPAIEFIAQEYQEKLMVVKVDHDLNPRLIEEYKVYGLPSLIVFQNGQEVPESRREGAITKVKLKEYVDKLMDSVSIV